MGLARFAHLGRLGRLHERAFRFSESNTAKPHELHSLFEISIFRQKIEYDTLYARTSHYGLTMSWYIYMMRHVSAYAIPQPYQILQKIGSTKNPSQRLRTYYTYYPIRPVYHALYKIESNCYKVDTLIRRAFAHHNVRIGGGTEFYTLDVTDKILERFFSANRIGYVKII